MKEDAISLWVNVAAAVTWTRRLNQTWRSSKWNMQTLQVGSKEQQRQPQTADEAVQSDHKVQTKEKVLTPKRSFVDVGRECVNYSRQIIKTMHLKWDRRFCFLLSKHNLNWCQNCDWKHKPVCYLTHVTQQDQDSSINVINGDEVGDEEEEEEEGNGLLEQSFASFPCVCVCVCLIAGCL